jgi:hypothetical protein
MDMFLCLGLIFMIAPRAIGGELVCGMLIAWEDGKRKYAAHLAEQAEIARAKVEKEEWKAMP